MKQKNSDPKFVSYVTPKAPKEATSSTPAPSSFLTSTSVLINLDLEIVQKVFGSLPNKEIVNNISENTSSSKDRSKLLDPDKYLEDDDIEEDLKDFTIITKATTFAVTSNIKFTPKEKNNSKIILAINNDFAQNDDFRGINTFCDFSQYKADMQFNKRIIHVTDISLQMKPANIKQDFAKYRTVLILK
ncbi:4290_t:CDS:2 [Funneliformis geosporum]|uniref:4290_t:CDS:1 n=1 Tax=Funneliformis geosporum TaxID=1117311 RepID=A0A9W4SYG6_9GLOM|nr:4290_t:CDS:2 [Funneliformis geosporum]